MKLWTRFVVVGLALALALSLGVDSANAASKKKKKETKKQEKKEEKREVRHRAVSSNKSVIEGANINGRPGYFFSDTANTPNKGQIMGAAHGMLLVLGGGSNFSIPFGVAFGATDKLQLHISSNLTLANPAGLTMLIFGGKYGFPHVSTGLDIAAGLDFGIGPLNVANLSTFNFNPYGIVTYTTSDKLQLNGQLGIQVNGGTTFKIGNTSFTIPGTSWIQLNLGAAYPFDPELTGIAELSVNGQGSGATPFIVGIRTGHDVQLQAFAGLDMAGTVGLVLGGGVALFSN